MLNYENIYEIALVREISENKTKTEAKQLK